MSEWPFLLNRLFMVAHVTSSSTSSLATLIPAAYQILLIDLLKT